MKVWVTSAEAAAIRQKAKSDGFKYAGQFMAKAIRESVNGTTPLIQLNPVDMGNLARVGKSLNHIAKHVNSGGEYYKEMHEDVIYTGRLVKKLGQELFRLMRKSKSGAEQ
jgi:hypothetical protein